MHRELTPTVDFVHRWPLAQSVPLATYFRCDKLTIRDPKLLTQIQVKISKLYYFRKREVNKD